MRWVCLLFVVVACGPPARWQPPTRSNVEEIAVWFMRAALSGDESTARSLTLRYDEIAQISNHAKSEQEWNDAVTETIESLAKEGADEDPPNVTATVVSRTTLDPSHDEKVRQKTEVAIVQFEVRDHASAPFVFIKTEGGWKFSPKK